jgi:hypothetical protein
MNITHYPATKRKIVFMTGAALAMIGLSGDCLPAKAQATGPDEPRLYLMTSEVFPKKGHIEEGSEKNGKVSFRECGTSKSTPVDRNNLKEIFGKCEQPGGPWQTGTVLLVQPDDKSVTILTSDGKTVSLSAADWQQGFADQPDKDGSKKSAPPPKPGQLVAGKIMGKPEGLYLVERR